MAREKERGFFILFVIFLMLGSLFTGVVSAQTSAEIVNNLQGFFTPILTALFGGGENVFLYLLFGLLILALVFAALDQVAVIAARPFALWTISIVVSLISIRFIAQDKNLVSLIFFPNGVTGFALLTIIPFAVYFWFVEFGLEGPKNKLLRRVAWGVYIAAFIYLYYITFVKTGETVTYSKGSLFYILAAGISLICLTFDGALQRYISKARAEEAEEINKIKMRSLYMEEKLKLEERLRTGAINQHDFDRLYRDLKDRAQASGITTI